MQTRGRKSIFKEAKLLESDPFLYQCLEASSLIVDGPLKGFDTQLLPCSLVRSLPNVSYSYTHIHLHITNKKTAIDIKIMFLRNQIFNESPMLKLTHGADMSTY